MIKVGTAYDIGLPGYRRRCMPLIKASDNEMLFENYDSGKNYDLIMTNDILGTGKNIETGKLLLNLPDSILYRPYEWYREPFKTLYKIADFQKIKKLKKQLREIKGVITGSFEQMQEYKRYNKNVGYIVDPITDDLIVRKESKPVMNKEIKIGIECGGLNVHSILNNKGFCEFINESDNVELFIIIDNIQLPKAYKYRDVHRALLKRFKGKVVLYNWTKENYDKLMNTIDISVIPVDEKCRFAAVKPPNRPLIMLVNKIPVVCTPIHAYYYVFNNLQSCKFANTTDEWIAGVNNHVDMLGNGNFPNHESNMLIEQNSNKRYFEYHKKFIFDLLSSR